MDTLKDLPIMLFADKDSFRQWLHGNHDTSTGIWIKFAKKAAPTPSATYDEALDIALCYGWIDGQLQTYDEHYFLRKFTHRRPKSIWSKRNIEKIGQLTKAGLLQPAGLAEVEAAKKDGRWDQAYDSSRNMMMPDDFKQALEDNPKAKAMYATLNRANTYAILWRLQTAKKAETRNARMATLIDMLNQGKKLY